MSKTESATVVSMTHEIAGIVANTAQNGNYIGAILEACTKRRTEPPTYTYGQDVSPSHAPVFVCRCELLGVVVEGRGPSKKAAKQQATQLWVDGVLDDE